MTMENTEWHEKAQSRLYNHGKHGKHGNKGNMGTVLPCFPCFPWFNFSFFKQFKASLDSVPKSSDERKMKNH